MYEYATGTSIGSGNTLLVSDGDAKIVKCMIQDEDSRAGSPPFDIGTLTPTCQVHSRRLVKQELY